MKYDYFILLYDKQWGTRQLSYPWWTLLNAIIIMSTRLSYAFVDGPGSWASRAVAGSEVVEVVQKYFLSVGFSLFKPAY